MNSLWFCHMHELCSGELQFINPTDYVRQKFLKYVDCSKHDLAKKTS